jgi:hypothetical protein
MKTRICFIIITIAVVCDASDIPSSGELASVEAGNVLVDALAPAADPRSFVLTCNLLLSQDPLSAEKPRTSAQVRVRLKEIYGHVAVPRDQFCQRLDRYRPRPHPLHYSPPPPRPHESRN